MPGRPPLGDVKQTKEERAQRLRESKVAKKEEQKRKQRGYTSTHRANKKQRSAHEVTAAAHPQPAAEVAPLPLFLQL